MLEKSKFERIGTIGRTHGIHGEVAMKLDVELSDLFDDEEELFLMLEEGELLIPYAVVGLRQKAGDIDLVRFSRIESREAAEKLVGLAVWLDKAYIGEDKISEDPLDWERYRSYILIDQATGLMVGTIEDIDSTTLNTLLFVKREDGEELILPIAEELLCSYDDEGRTLTLNIPAGLLDDSAEYDIHA